jgi:hypothetical protein
MARKLMKIFRERKAEMSQGDNDKANKPILQIDETQTCMCQDDVTLVLGDTLPANRIVARSSDEAYDSEAILGITANACKANRHPVVRC